MPDRLIPEFIRVRAGQQFFGQNDCQISVLSRRQVDIWQEGSCRLDEAVFDMYGRLVIFIDNRPCVRMLCCHAKKSCAESGQRRSYGEQFDAILSVISNAEKPGDVLLGLFFYIRGWRRDDEPVQHSSIHRPS